VSSGAPSLPQLDGNTLVATSDWGGGRRRRFSVVVRRLVHSPTFWIALAIVLFWVVMAIGWRWLAPHDPYAVSSDRLQSPSRDHLLGTDQLGRDTLSRTLAGSESVLLIAPAAIFLATIGGTILALIGGFYRGSVDDVLMRVTDGFLAFPLIIPLMIILSLLGPSKLTILGVISVTYMFLIAPTIRSLVIVEREKEYVEAGRLRGERGWYLTGVEILPNITGPVFVEMTVRIGYAIFFIGALSFLGLGLQPPSSDWGLMISAQRQYLELAPWTVFSPAVAIASLIIAINLLADTINSAMSR